MINKIEDKVSNGLNKENVIILGSGPAGLTAGLYLARAGFKPLLLEGTTPGGLVSTTTTIENYPGFPTGIGGFELMMEFKKQAENHGCRIVSDLAQKVDIQENNIKVQGLSKEYNARALIVATGSNPRKLGVPGEDKFWSKGIAACATCDAALFKGKKVIVAGGGNTALTDALFLTKFTSEVKLMHRSGEFRAEKTLEDRVVANKDIEVLFFHEIKEFLGSNKLEKVRVFNSQTKKELEIEVDGLFLAIGHIPNTDIFEGQLDLTKGYIDIKEAFTSKTSRVNVFACGDVMDYKYQQAVVSAGTGCMAALDVQNYLDSLK